MMTDEQMDLLRTRVLEALMRQPQLESQKVGRMVVPANRYGTIAQSVLRGWASQPRRTQAPAPVTDLSKPYTP
jgi:hypothetical protein